MAKTLMHRSPHRAATPSVLLGPVPFYPATLSDDELAFLLDHLEDPPAAVLQGEMPPGVNPSAIEQALVPMHELEQIRLHRGLAWAGFELVRDVIVRYQAWQELSRDIQQQGGPRHPSMFSWDSQGTQTRSTPGTDSDMVRHEILDDGTRRPLFIEDLRRVVQVKTGPRLPWVKREAPVTDAILHDDSKGLLTCSVCDHTVTYNRDRGRAALNMARGQMARHLKASRKEANRHRALYRKEFL